MEVSKSDRQDSHRKKLEEAADLVVQKREDEAYGIYASLLNQDFDDVDALYGLARLYREGEHFGMAYNLFRLCAGFKRLGAAPWNSMALCHAETWDLDAAIALTKRALAINPRDKHSLGNMSLFHVLKCEPKKALEYADMALKQDPNFEEVLHHQSYARLMVRDWERGWEGHQKILGRVKTRTERFYENRGKMLPRWDGSPGKSVLVYGEQGIGDEISFSSCIPDLVKVSKKVVLDCDHRLESLFKKSFPEVAVHGTRFSNPLDWIDDYELDARIAVGDLPRFFRNSDEEFPGTPFLKAEPLELGRKPVIGIAWTGGLPNTGSAKRSLSLEALEPIFRSCDATWVSLEYKDRNDEVQAFKANILQPEEARSQNYEDTARLVAGLDLVVSVSTAVVHLAGGLGKECWCLVPSKPRWWYGIDGDRTPWYKSVQFFRQPGNDWSKPIGEVARLLQLRYGCS